MHLILLVMDKTVEGLIYEIVNKKKNILFFFEDTIMVGKDLGGGEIDKQDIIELKIKPSRTIKETLSDILYILETKENQN